MLVTLETVYHTYHTTQLRKLVLIIVPIGSLWCNCFNLAEDASEQISKIIAHLFSSPGSGDFSSSFHYGNFASMNRPASRLNMKSRFYCHFCVIIISTIFWYIIEGYKNRKESSSISW